MKSGMHSIVHINFHIRNRYGAFILLVYSITLAILTYYGRHMNCFLQVLDFSEICKDTKKGDEHAIFDLQSIVVHAGEYGSGHYYAYVRPNIRKNKWYRYDDDRVMEVSFKDVKDDAFGGHAVNKGSGKKAANRKKVGLWKRILSSASPNRNQFGWGGRSSSAYMLQYVKRSDIPYLYD